MKQYLFLATTIATASLFTGCSNNEYVGDQPEALNGTDGVIAFSMGKANTTRATTLSRDASAGKLNNVFYVYGEKTVNDEPHLVFNTYKVNYINNPANPSASNTTGWEYVGISRPETSLTQTIKYWDYSASKYDFEAYSKTTGSVVRTDAGDYEVTQLNSPKDLYFAQKNTMLKPADGGKYGVVKLTFQSVLSKIRVGFYETIPGYSVKIDKFYKSNADGSDWVATEENNQNFVACCPNKKANDDHPFFVRYDNAIPAVTKAAGTTDGSYYAFNETGYTLDAQLTLGTNLRTQNQIGETSSTVTWDNIDGESNPIYTYFIPQNQLLDGKVQPMRIKVDYTLKSTDGQTTEQIKVKGATAIVPAQYLNWEPNKAYSYVFKISDQTNGNTGETSDPAGLYPIIFDAAVVDMDMDGSTTTVSTPSVTAKQDGTTPNYVKPDGIVFQLNTPIDLKVMNGNNEVNDATITGDYIENYDYGKTPDQNCPNMSSIENSTLAGKDKAGYWVLKVETDLAITYVIIRVGSAEEYPAIP